MEDAVIEVDLELKQYPNIVVAMYFYGVFKIKRN